MPEIPSLIFFNHLCNASVGQNVSSVYQPIQHLSCLLYQVRLVGVVFKLIIWLQVQDHVKGLPVVRNLLVQPCQVKLVLNVVLVHLAEELVPTKTAEPRDPGYLREIKIRKLSSFIEFSLFSFRF